MISCQSECRLKHLSTRKYLALSYTANSEKPELILTEDLTTYENETVFTLHSIDPEIQRISYDAQYRIQSGQIGKKNSFWLHAGDFINETKESVEEPFQYQRSKFIEVPFY